MKKKTMFPGKVQGKMDSNPMDKMVKWMTSKDHAKKNVSLSWW